jgi:hypothetical protein
MRVLIYSTLGRISAKYGSSLTARKSGDVCLVSKYELKDCALTTNPERCSKNFKCLVHPYVMSQTLISSVSGMEPWNVTRLYTPSLPFTTIPLIMQLIEHT